MAATRSPSSSESLASPRGLTFTRSIKQQGRQWRALALSSPSSTSSRSSDHTDSDRSRSGSPQWVPLSAGQPSARRALYAVPAHSTPAAVSPPYTAQLSTPPRSSTIGSAVRQPRLAPASTASGMSALTPASLSSRGACPGAPPTSPCQAASLLAGAGSWHEDDKENACGAQPGPSSKALHVAKGAGWLPSSQACSVIVGCAAFGAANASATPAHSTMMHAPQGAGCLTNSPAASVTAPGSALAPSPDTAGRTAQGSTQQQTPTSSQSSDWRTPEQPQRPQQQLLQTLATGGAAPATGRAPVTPAMHSITAPGTILDPYTPWLCTVTKQRRSFRSSTSGHSSPVVLSSDSSSGSSYDDAGGADAGSSGDDRGSGGSSNDGSSNSSMGSGQHVLDTTPRVHLRQPFNGSDPLSSYAVGTNNDAYAFLGSDKSMVISSRARSRAGSRASSSRSSGSRSSGSGSGGSRTRPRRRLIVIDSDSADPSASSSPASPSNNTARAPLQPPELANAHRTNSKPLQPRTASSIPGTPTFNTNSRPLQPTTVNGRQPPADTSTTNSKPLQPSAALEDAVPAFKAMPPRPRGGRAAGQAQSSWQDAAVRKFVRQRKQMAQELYNEWNETVFEGQLPVALPLVWNTRLLSTAGQVVDDKSHNHLKTQRSQMIACRLELSPKVIDTEERLRSTLAHEMCHVGAWMISHDYDKPHGSAFKHWGRRFESLVAGIEVTTCHSYNIHKPHRWQCQNPRCAKVFSRHVASIDPKKHVCGICRSKLTYLGKFRRDGQAAAPKAPPSAFSLYVKQHFAATKKHLPPGTPHREVMSSLGSAWKASKQAAAEAAAVTAVAARAQAT